MTKYLYYTIAGHLLAIETPSPDDTVQLLPCFQPFRVALCYNNMLPDGAKPLLFFNGNEQLEKPNNEPDEEACIEGVMFRIYHHEDGTLVVIKRDDVEYKMHASADRSTYKTNLSLIDPREQFFVLSFLRIAFTLASAGHKTVKFHGSVIEKEGKALIFLGKSGTGKSTHSRLCLEYVTGCSLINDDEPIVRIMDNNEVQVFGAPWSGSTPCYRNVLAKTAAFVHLVQHNENILIKLSVTDAYVSLLQSAAMLQSDKENMKKVISTALDIAERVPVYKLYNKPNQEAVTLSASILTKNNSVS